MWNYAYPEFFTEFYRTVYLSREECAIAVKTGVFFFEGRRVETAIGRDTGISYFAKGRTSDNGHCYPSSQPFISGNTTFDYHVEEVFLYMRFEEIEGTRDLQHDIVVFDDVRATLSKGYIHAPTHALYWDTKIEFTCDKGLLQSYDGTAQVKTLTSKGGSYEGAIVMVAPDDGKEIFAAFKLEEKVTICDLTTYSTNVPDTFVYIVPYNGDRLPLAKFGNSRYTAVESIQILTGNTAMQFRNNENMYGGFRTLTEELCRVERASLQNKLNHIAGGGKYGLTEEYGPGYQISIAGSVAYVAKCQEKEATLATFHNCTHELPVRIGPNDTSQVFFADPLTYNLVHFPTIFACDPVMPHKWVINGAWYCSRGEGVMLCDAPKTLDPETGIMGMADFAKNLDGGIFSREQYEQHAVAMILDGSKDSVIAEMVAAAVVGKVTHPDGAVQFGLALPEYQVEEMDNNFLSKYFSWVLYFGKNCSRVMYIFLALQIAKWLWDTLLLFQKGWEKHGTYGKWMLGLFCHSVWDLIFESKNTQRDDCHDAAEEGSVPAAIPVVVQQPKPDYYDMTVANESAATSVRFERSRNLE